MNYRTDFVTNSSSSSFIAVSRCELPDIQYIRQSLSDSTLIIGLHGTIKFDRSFKISKDFYSKLNYLALTILYQDDVASSSYKQRLNTLLHKDLGVEVVWSLIELLKSHSEAYIDHQSIGRGFKIIINSDDSIRRFLYNDNSVLINSTDESLNSFRNIDKYFLNRKELYDIDDSDVESYKDEFQYCEWIIPSRDKELTVDSIKPLLTRNYVNQASELLKLLQFSPIDKYSVYDDLYEDILSTCNLEDSNMLVDKSVTLSQYVNALTSKVLQRISKLEQLRQEGYTFYISQLISTDSSVELIKNSLLDQLVFKKDSNVIVLRF